MIYGLYIKLTLFHRFLFLFWIKQLQLLLTRKVFSQILQRVMILTPIFQISQIRSTSKTQLQLCLMLIVWGMSRAQFLPSLTITIYQSVAPIMSVIRESQKAWCLYQIIQGWMAPQDKRNLCAFKIFSKVASISLGIYSFIFGHLMRLPPFLIQLKRLKQLNMISVSCFVIHLMASVFTLQTICGNEIILQRAMIIL